MTAIRPAAPIVASIVLGLVLAACGQAVAKPIASDTPKPTPVARPSTDPTPEPTARPTATPVATPTPAPTEDPKTPTATPTPKPVVTPAPQPAQPAPVQVLQHELPMLARSLGDQVNVRERPDLQAPLLRWDTGDESYDVRIAKGQLVTAVAGPLYADGESWYRVMSASSDGDHRPFGYGWVAGRFLERIEDIEYGAIVKQVHGLGRGTSFDADVPKWSPLTVEFAAAPMPNRASCSIEILFTNPAGRTVEVATFTADASIVGSVTSPEVEELYVDAAGTVNLTVNSDCSFHVALMAYPF